MVLRVETFVDGLGVEGEGEDVLRGDVKRKDEDTGKGKALVRRWQSVGGARCKQFCDCVRIREEVD